MSCLIWLEQPSLIASCEKRILKMLKILNFFSTKKAAAASPAVDTHQNSISRSSQQTIDGAVTYALVVNAEIRWALKCVMADYPNNSNRAMSNLFPVIFPDSPTTAKYQVGPNKLRYSINFGLGPFQREANERYSKL